MSDYPEEYTDGSVLFCGQRFNVDPRALIPRFETEELVKYCTKILREHPEIQTIADIGTGSGVIPISIAHKTDRNLNVFATDLSPDALDLARENYEKLSDKSSVLKNVDCFAPSPGEGGQNDKLKEGGLVVENTKIEGKMGRGETGTNPPVFDRPPSQGGRIPMHFLQGDLLQPLIQHLGKNTPESILITANLPYVREVEVNSTLIHEPRMAFVGGGRTGFDLYEKFFEQLKNWKHRPKQCHIVIEFGLWQRDIAETVLAGYGWDGKFFADLRGIERFAHVIWN